MTTDRGYPVFTGGAAPAGPTQMQQLAEAIDADMTASLTRPQNFMQGLPGAGNTDVSGVVGAAVTLAGLSFTAALVADKAVRVSTQVTTYSTSSDDVLEIALFVGITQIASFTVSANTVGIAGSAQTHQYSGYYVAPTTGTATVQARVKRVAGGGTTTVTGGASYLIAEAS